MLNLLMHVRLSRFEHSTVGNGWRLEMIGDSFFAGGAAKFKIQIPPTMRNAVIFADICIIKISMYKYHYKYLQRIHGVNNQMLLLLISVDAVIFCLIATWSPTGSGNETVLVQTKR